MVSNNAYLDMHATLLQACNIESTAKSGVQTGRILAMYFNSTGVQHGLHYVRNNIFALQLATIGLHRCFCGTLAAVSLSILAATYTDFFSNCNASSQRLISVCPEESTNSHMLFIASSIYGCWNVCMQGAAEEGSKIH